MKNETCKIVDEGNNNIYLYVKNNNSLIKIKM